MKIAQLMLILSLFAPFGLIAMQQEQQQASLETLPSDIKKYILNKLIEVDPSLKPYDLSDFRKTMNNIASFAQIDHEFRKLINNPYNMQWLVKILAARFKNKYERIQTGEIHIFSLGNNGNETRPFYEIYPIDELYIARGLANMPGIKSKEFQQWIMEMELIAAASDNNLTKVKELIAKGANINAINARGGTPLLDLLSRFGCLKEDYFAFQILRNLLAAGANVNAQDSAGRTPIIFATMYQCPDAMREILKYNPDLNIAGYDDQTAFNFAIPAWSPEFLQILLDYVQQHGIILNPEIVQLLQDYEEYRKEMAEQQQGQP